MSETLPNRVLENTINHISVLGERGTGGGYNHYYIQPDSVDGTDIIFKTLTEDGVTNEDLLEIVKDRLVCFQSGQYPCEENSEALDGICKALFYLNKRTKDRENRGVEGKAAR